MLCATVCLSLILTESLAKAAGNVLRPDVRRAGAASRDAMLIEDDLKELTITTSKDKDVFDTTELSLDGSGDTISNLSAVDETSRTNENSTNVTDKARGTNIPDGGQSTGPVTNTAEETPGASREDEEVTQTAYRLSSTNSQSMKGSTTAPFLDEESGSGDEQLRTTTDFQIEQIPDVCLNTTCFDDLFVSNVLVPEGSNLTLLCAENGTAHSRIHWYKVNGTTHTLLAFGDPPRLGLSVQDSKTPHSGTYMCVKWKRGGSCCSAMTKVTVYSLPHYKYHLVVIGLATFACLALCIFLSTRQIRSFRKYTKSFVEKHGSVKQQLLT